MKKIFTVIATGIFFIANTIPVFALNSVGKVSTSSAGRIGITENTTIQLRQKAVVASKVVTTKIDDLKQRASSEISRRITSLTDVSNRISKIKRLTDSQKTQLINNIQSEIASLNTTNTKIQSDTDIEALRADVKSIVDSYRIYLLYLPETRILIAADGLLNAIDKFSEYASKLQTRVAEAKGKGEDTSSLETILVDMQSKIADAKTQANNAISSVSSLQPTDYPGNKPALQSAQTMLKTAWKDVQSARQDAVQVLEGLRALNKKSVTPGIGITHTIVLPKGINSTEAPEATESSKE
jgi:hypothetical protein